MSLVTVLVNRNCGHCLRAIEQVEKLAQRSGNTVAATDITAHPEVCEALRIKKSPAVLFEDGVAYAGVPDGPTFEALAHVPAA